MKTETPARALLLWSLHLGTKKKKLLKGIDSYLCVHSEVDKEGSSNSYVPASRLLKGFNMKLGHALFFTANIFEIIFFSHTINRIN